MQQFGSKSDWRPPANVRTLAGPIKDEFRWLSIHSNIRPAGPQWIRGRRSNSICLRRTHFAATPTRGVQEVQFARTCKPAGQMDRASRRLVACLPGRQPPPTTTTSGAPLKQLTWLFYLRTIME